MEIANVLTPEQRLSIRQDIINFEEEIKKHPASFTGDSDLCPLTHTFTDGIYTRKIFIPAGMFIVGKIHKHQHPNFLMSGIAFVLTEKGEEILEGPIAMFSDPGTKRALYAVTDLVWITIHHNPDNLTDLKELEELIIAKDYEEYEKFQLQQQKLLNLIK